VNLVTMIEARPLASPGRRGAAGRLAVRLAALILLGWGMGVLVLHVAPGVFHWGVDRPVSRWVHAHHIRGLGRALGRVALFGSEPVVLAVALVAGVIWAARRRKAAPLVALGLASAGGAAIALFVKLAVRRGQSAVSLSLAGVTHLGFPSGHATLAAAVYGTAAGLLLAGRPAGLSPTHDRSPARRWLRTAGAVGLVTLVITIGVARVYNGQHDTTDVIAGWILGGIWARAVTAQRSEHRGHRPHFPISARSLRSR
jgi:membrane-associated phospholipid phosphatase